MAGFCQGGRTPAVAQNKNATAPNISGKKRDRRDKFPNHKIAPLKIFRKLWFIARRQSKEQLKTTANIAEFLLALSIRLCFLLRDTPVVLKARDAGNHPSWQDRPSFFHAFMAIFDP
jgi:hypothetical protein